jgi:hypothetical protein
MAGGCIVWAPLLTHPSQLIRQQIRLRADCCPGHSWISGDIQRKAGRLSKRMRWQHREPRLASTF